jgi:hypothetical protein
MNEAATRGCRSWNWGGTWESQHSLRHFKAGWGARDLPYRYLVGATAEGLALLASEPKRLSGAFGYFYLYPFDRLQPRLAS